MSEHPQQIDRTLRDTRILTLRIWGVVGCIVIAAVIFNLMGILAPVIEFLAHMTQSTVKGHNGPADRLQSVGGACR